MRNFSKCIAKVMVCVCLVLVVTSMPVRVHALETESAESRMTYITSYTTDLSISSTGVATITGSVRGKSGVTSSYVTCTLQMSVGGDWVDVKSWTDANNARGSTVAQTYQLSSRGTYRVFMECGANTEEKTLTSAYRTY